MWHEKERDVESKKNGGNMELTLFNCGQGDSMLLHPRACYWSDIPLLIDAGPIGFTPPLNGSNEIDLLLTHSHDDHIGGVANINAKVRTLYLPAYFPEIIKIARYIEKKFPSNRNALALNDVNKHKWNNIEVLYEGCQIGKCQHAEVFNPPLDPAVAIHFELLLNEDIRMRVNAFSQELFGVGPDEINEVRILENAEFGTPEGYQGRNFIYIFLDLMRSYWLEDRDAEKAFNSVVKYDANKISVVFKFEIPHRLDVLFTGDADKSVFNRLIRQGRHTLEAEVLKVPHHGSRYNLSSKILKSISPQIALVSHSNGKFGKAKDPHPNTQTIQWLIDSCGIQNVYYTNDVVKNGNTVAGHFDGIIPNYQIQIQQ